jgi:hypothetical protein
MQQGNISGRFLEMGQLQPTPTNRQQGIFIIIM